MKKLKILVLGGRHFIARHVAAAIAASDWASNVVDPESFDAGNDRSLQAALAMSDAVVSATSGTPSQIRAGADHLYACAASGSHRPRIVHLSSMTVYGAVVGRIDESAPLRPDLSDYAAAHIAAESRAAAWPNAVVLRLGCEYGPGCPEWSERIARLLLARRLGDLGTAGDGCCNLVYVDDLTDAILAALSASHIEGQAFNLAMADAPTWNEYFTRFAKALGAVPLRRISGRRLKWESTLLAPPLQIAALTARRLRLPIRTPPVLSPSLARACEQQIQLDSRKAERLLDVRWTSLDDGLARAAAALR